MTLSIEIPEELEAELVTEADRLGLSLSEYTLRLLRVSRLTGDLPRTGPDLVTYWRRENLAPVPRSRIARRMPAIFGSRRNVATCLIVYLLARHPP